MPLLYIKASNRGYFLFDNGYSSHNYCERQLRWQRLVWGVRRGRRRRSCGCRGLTLNPQHRSALRLGLTIPRTDPRDIPPSARQQDLAQDFHVGQLADCCQNRFGPRTKTSPQNRLDAFKKTLLETLFARQTLHGSYLRHMFFTHCRSSAELVLPLESCSRFAGGWCKRINLPTAKPPAPAPQCSRFPKLLVKLNCLELTDSVTSPAQWHQLHYLQNHEGRE
jgi:hypothetical protein